MARAAKCKYCGGMHQTRCPEVKRMTFHLDGEVESVEFFSPLDMKAAEIELASIELRAKQLGVQTDGADPDDDC